MLGVTDKVTDTITHTRDKILIASARLFAVRGYDAVSTRDIAAAVQVRASSIYAHYAGKEEVLNELFHRTGELLASYYARLANENKQADSIDQIIDNLFFEVKDVYTIFTYYGISAAQNCMIWHEGARKVYLEGFLGDGRRHIRDALDAAVERGLVEPFDTDIVAHIVMDAVNTGNKLRIAESEGIDMDFALTDMYIRLEAFLLHALRSGLYAIS